MCCIRWHCWVNLRSHSLQTKGLIPRWIRLCCDKYEELEKLLQQVRHLWGFGSWLWTFWECSIRWGLLSKICKAQSPVCFCFVLWKPSVLLHKRTSALHGPKNQANFCSGSLCLKTPGQVVVRIKQQHKPTRGHLTDTEQWQEMKENIWPEAIVSFSKPKPYQISWHKLQRRSATLTQPARCDLYWGERRKAIKNFSKSHHRHLLRHAYVTGPYFFKPLVLALVLELNKSHDCFQNLCVPVNSPTGSFFSQKYAFCTTVHAMYKISTTSGPDKNNGFSTHVIRQKVHQMKMIKVNDTWPLLMGQLTSCVVEDELVAWTFVHRSYSEKVWYQRGCGCAVTCKMNWQSTYGK